MKKIKSFSEISSFCSGCLGMAALIGFVLYGLIYQYMDTVVVLMLIIGMAGSFLYVILEGKWAELGNLLGAAAYSFGLGLFFLNSYPVWADRLNHINMYASRGTLVPVITIMVIFLAAIAAAIISCFGRRRRV